MTDFIPCPCHDISLVYLTASGDFSFSKKAKHFICKLLQASLAKLNQTRSVKVRWRPRHVPAIVLILCSCSDHGYTSFASPGFPSDQARLTNSICFLSPKSRQCLQAAKPV